MKELDELDKQKSLYQLMTKLNEAETSIREKGTISADDRAQDIRWMSVMRGPERSGDIEPRFNVSIRMKKRPVRVFFYADDRT